MRRLFISFFLTGLFFGSAFAPLVGARQKQTREPGKTKNTANKAESVVENADDSRETKAKKTEKTHQTIDLTHIPGQRNGALAAS